MTGEDRLRGLLGLAARARQIVTGEEMAVRAIRAGKAAAAFLDAEASKNADKRLTDACAHYNVPLRKLPAGMLGAACGKHGRMAAAMPKGGLADSMLKAADSIASQQDETPETID